MRKLPYTLFGGFLFVLAALFSGAAQEPAPRLSRILGTWSILESNDFAPDQFTLAITQKSPSVVSMELRTEGRLVNSKLYYLDSRKGGLGESEWTTRWVGETLTTTTRNRLTGVVIAVSTLSLHANGQLVYVIENRSSLTSRKMKFRRLSGEEAK